MKVDVKRQNELIQKWLDIPVGTPVVVRRDNGQEMRTKTRSEPWLTRSNMAVILLDGISGCYSLDRVREI